MNSEPMGRLTGAVSAVKRYLIPKGTFNLNTIYAAQIRTSFGVIANLKRYPASLSFNSIVK